MATMATVWLARATREDTSALAALEAACHSHPWTEAQFLEEVGYGPPNAVLVLRGPPAPSDPGQGVRAYCVYRVIVDEMHILNIAVAPAGRRRGLARWLMGFAMRHAARSGARRAFLEVRSSNREALGLYESLGFSRVSVRRDYYREPSEDAIVLEREKLPPAHP
jgi:ribosomal-protein-alanine N-acetyltransferase